MDSKWFTRAVAELRTGRIIGACAWSTLAIFVAVRRARVDLISISPTSAFDSRRRRRLTERHRDARAQAYAYFTCVHILGGDFPHWSRVAVALTYAATQLPASAATAMCARASTADFVPNGERDACGIVRGERIGERFATAMMRDGMTIGALGGAFACSGSLACSLAARTTPTRGLVGMMTVNASDATFAAQFGCVLGVMTVVNFWFNDGLVVKFSSVQRPRGLRLKRAFAPCALSGLKRSLYACVVHILVVIASRFLVQLSAKSSRGLFLGSMSCWGAGALASASWALAIFCAEIVHTERYEFRPQSLTQGPKVASEPLMAALHYFEVPFVQHLAFADLCNVAESGGRGRRQLIYGDTPDAAWSVVISIALAPLASISRSVNKAMDRTMLAALRDTDADAAQRISEKYAQMNTPKPKFRHESAQTQQAWNALRQSEVLSTDVAARELCTVVKAYGQLAIWGARASSSLAVAAKKEDVRGNARSINPSLSAIVRTLLTAQLACRTIIEQGSPPVRASSGFTSSDLASTSKANSIVAKRNEIINNVLYVLGITATNRNDANGAVTPAFTPAVETAKRISDTVEIALGALVVEYGDDVKVMLRESEQFGPPEFGTPNELFDALETIATDLA